MEENEVYEEGLTFKELFSYIWSKKILGLIIAVITLVVSFTGLFLYSKSDATYTSKFNLKWSGINSQQYPDGSSFRYRDIISVENIEYVIDNNESLSYLTPEKLLKKDNMKLDQVTHYIDDENKELGTKTYYLLESGASVFKNDDDAKLFFEEIVTHQYEIALNKINNFRFENALDSIIESTEYNVIFNLVNRQLTSVTQYIESVASSHAGDFEYEEGKTLTDLRNQIRDYSNQYYNSNIQFQYINDHFVRDIDTAKGKFEIEKTNILKQIDRKNEYLDRLAQEAERIPGTNITSDAYINKIGPVLEEIIELQYRLEYLESSTLIFDQKYNDTVDKYVEGLNKLTVEANKVKKSVNLDTLDLRFDNHEIVEYESFGTIKAAVLSLVIAIVLPFIVLLIMCLVKRPGNDKKALETVENKVVSEVKEVETKENK